MTRIIACLALAALLLGCTTDDGVRPPQDLGAFELGYNVVIASKMKKGPVSRDATQQEWVDTLTQAVETRFGGYDGNQLYHFGISVEGYMLAPPGVPVIYNPRSALIINVTIWDDAANAKLNAEPKQFTIFEDTTSESFALGSGHTRTKEEQLKGLADNAMDAIEDWMVEMHKTEGWFDPRPGAATTATIDRTQPGRPSGVPVSGTSKAEDAVSAANG